ncbi:neuropathy target esterase sws-like [Folsomia candida]|uniref:neuropathy target esterase sws-like n=1 Tax=Folsomia candida TaxID=158441 RepID=UPI00160515C3|nr:neuropathy target esterase sws-like [Folsomia candida]
MLHRVLGLALIAIADPPTPLLLQSQQSSLLSMHHDDYPIPAPTEDIPDQIREDAIKSFATYLGIPGNSNVLDNCLLFIFDPDQRPREEILTGHPVIDNENIKFKYIFKGQVELYRINSNLQDDNDADTEAILTHETLYILFPGEGVGGLSTFAEVDNFLFMRIIRRTIIVATTQKINQRLFQQYPCAILPMANQIIKRLSPTIRKMDFGLEWAMAEGGKALFVTGSEVRDTFVVLEGRLRSYMIDPKGKLTYYGEYERNDWIGLVEALVRYPVRSKTVIAVRDTEICKIPIDFITFLKTTFDAAAFSLLGYIGHRVGKYRFYTQSLKLSPEMQLVAGTSRRCASLSLIPAIEDMPYIPFAKEIKMHHDIFGPSVVLSWITVQEEFNLEFLDYDHEYMVETWVLSMLARHDLVIFVCSNESLQWTE